MDCLGIYFIRYLDGCYLMHRLQSCRKVECSPWKTDLLRANFEEIGYDVDRVSVAEDDQLLGDYLAGG